MKAHKIYSKTKKVQIQLCEAGLPFDTDFFAVKALMRAERTLHRWSELECNGEIQRDDATGKPRLFYGQLMDKSCPARDLEAGALRRVKKICNEKGVQFYHQTDPRGCALYLSTEPLDQANYHARGVAVC